MIQAASDKFVKWWSDAAWPFLQAWWAQLDDNPGYNFATFCASIALLYAMKFMAWLVW